MTSGLIACMRAITAASTVTMPTWNAPSVTPFTSAPAMARWYQRPRSGAHDSWRAAMAMNRMTAAAASRTPTTNRSGDTSRRPTRAVTNDELHIRMKM